MSIRNRTQNKIQQAKRYDQIQQLFYIRYMKLKRTYNGYEGFLYFLLPSETYKDSIYRAKSLKIIYNIHFRRKQGPKSWIYRWPKKHEPGWKHIFFQIKLCNGNNCACQAKVPMHQEQRSWLPNDGTDQQVSSLVGILPAYTDMLLTKEQICYC